MRRENEKRERGKELMSTPSNHLQQLRQSAQAPLKHTPGAERDHTHCPAPLASLGKHQPFWFLLLEKFAHCQRMWMYEQGKIEISQEREGQTQLQDWYAPSDGKIVRRAPSCTQEAAHIAHTEKDHCDQERCQALTIRHLGHPGPT